MDRGERVLDKAPSDISINIPHANMLDMEDQVLKNVAASALEAEDVSPINPRPTTMDIDRISPRLLNRLTPDRREHIIRILRRTIPMVAKERRALIKKNADYAKLCILDAFQGRLSNGLANNSKKSKWIYTIFCVQTSDWMFKAVVLASVLHTISIFFEPENACPNYILFKFYQAITVLIYAVDISLKMGYEGPQEYFRHDWQQLYVLNLAILVVDLLCCGCTYYANPLRPVAGVLRARRGRKFFDVLKKMVPGMVHSLVPIVFFVLIIMALCSLSFDNLVEEFKSTAYTSYNWLFLIFTNDNFDRLLPGSIVINLSYLMFFFPAIYVGQRFLLSLIIGDTYDTFRSYVKKQLKKEKLKEMQGLTKAFAALDDKKCGVISDYVFKECMTSLHPEMSDEVIALYFELLAGGGQNGVNVLQFLSLRKVLSFKLTVTNYHNFFWNSLTYLTHSITREYNTFSLPVPDKIVDITTKIRDYITNGNMLNHINSFDIIIFSFDLSDHIMLQNSIGKLTLCHIISTIYFVELLIRFCAVKGKLSGVSTNLNTVSLLFSLGCLGTMFFDLLMLVNAEFFEKLIITIPNIISFPAIKFLVFFRLLRCIRMANLNEALKDFTAALMDILPALFETFLFTFIVTYIFGALGNLIFGSFMHEWSTPLRSIVKAQQLTFMVSFLESMENAMETIHPVCILYFGFYLVLSLTVSNIALSIIIDLHGTVLNANTKKNRDAQQKKLDLVFNKILNQARVRAMFSSKSNKSMNFKNITLSEFQTSDVRHFITDAGTEKDMKIEDLKQCQKYSSVDLVKFHNEIYQAHKDVNWEVEFLKNLQDLGIHQEKTFSKNEVVYKEGDKADKIYILVQGTVEISRLKPSLSASSSTAITPTNFMLASIRPGSIPNSINSVQSIDPADFGGTSVESALFRPTNLLGAEALSPYGRYSITVTADNDTKCIVFAQSDIVQKIDSDLSGAMLKMAFKSQTAIDAAIAETKKRRRSSLARSQSQMVY